MIRINVNEVLQQAAADIKTIDPAVSISIKIPGEPAETKVVSKTNRYPTSPGRNVPEILKEATINKITSAVKSELSNQAWSEYHKLKLERKKLSSQIFTMVKDGATRAHLKEHYNKIVSLLSNEKVLFDRARHIEQHGAPPEASTDSRDLLLLKEEKRKLSDERCKLQKKIIIGEAKNPNRFLQWQVRLDQANAEYAIIEEKIREISGT